MAGRLFPYVSMRYPLTILSIGAAASLFISLTTGSTDLSLTRISQLLWLDDGSSAYQIIHQLRLPRTLSAFAVGALLALAGTLMQVLLRNPLGDPYILGISGGASTAVLLSFLFGIPVIFQPGAALSGALLSMFLVFILARNDVRKLLLTGVVIAAGWGSLISLILSTSPPIQLPGMLFWLMGDLANATEPGLPLLVLFIGLVISLLLAKKLNLALLGDSRASALGVNVKQLQLILYVLASLLTATAVSVAGAIGFVGLIAPHFMRLLTGNDHRLVIPGAALLGGSLLTLADTAARTMIAPQQMPVGVLTAIIGVPVFLYLLNRKESSHAAV